MKEIKILIVEDTAFWGIMLSREFKKMGVSSDWVKNGKLAVDRIQEASMEYHGILMDIQMPLMNGLEATRRIRDLGFEKPIIGFSSMGDAEDIARGLEAGMNGYIKKSVDYKILETLLTKLEILKKA